MTKQAIGIIGAGSVGSAVGGALAKAGHDVVFGVRAGSSSPGMPIAEAAKRPVLLLAVPGNALAETAGALGNVSGKVVIDATNSFGPGAVSLQQLLGGAHVVKAFNTTGAENMGDASRLQHAPFMPVCGDHAESKQLVISLARDCGFDAHDVGGWSNAAGLEALARMWVTLARTGQGRDFAFAITRKR